MDLASLAVLGLRGLAHRLIPARSHCPSSEPASLPCSLAPEEAGSLGILLSRSYSPLHEAALLTP